MLDDHVVEAARAVLVIHTAVVVLIRPSGAFGSHIALSHESEVDAARSRVGALVGHAEAVDNHAAPLLVIFRTHRAIDVGDRGEGDRRVGRTNGHELGAAVNDHELVVGLPREGCAIFHGHGGTVTAFKDTRGVHLGGGAVGFTDEEAAFENVCAAVGKGREVDIDSDIVAGVSKGRAVGAVAVVPVGALARLAAAGDVRCAGVHGLLGCGGGRGVVAVGDGIVDGGRIDLNVTAAAAASENRQRRGRNKGVLTNHVEPPGVSFSR